MSEVSEAVEVRASLAETWDLYFEQRLWPVWSDGFDAVIETHGYPQEGGTLRWRSTAAGRGEVSERVLEHAPRRLHHIAFTDPQTEGELTTTFQMQGDATVVEQRLGYGLTDGGVLGWASDRLFIRVAAARLAAPLAPRAEAGGGGGRRLVLAPSRGAR